MFDWLANSVIDSCHQPIVNRFGFDLFSCEQDEETTSHPSTIAKDNKGGDEKSTPISTMVIITCSSVLAIVVTTLVIYVTRRFKRGPRRPEQSDVPPPALFQDVLDYAEINEHEINRGTHGVGIGNIVYDYVENDDVRRDRLLYSASRLTPDSTKRVSPRRDNEFNLNEPKAETVSARFSELAVVDGALDNTLLRMLYTTSSGYIHPITDKSLSYEQLNDDASSQNYRTLHDVEQGGVERGDERLYMSFHVEASVEDDENPKISCLRKPSDQPDEDGYLIPLS